GQEAIPLDASAQVKVTVGLELFHPAAFGAGVTVAVIVGGTLSATIVASNREERLAASKYRRRPVALLWPPQDPPAAFVPIRVSTFSDRTSVLPLKNEDEKGANETVTSFAWLGFLVTSVTQRVVPDAIKLPFLYNSARTSKFVP